MATTKSKTQRILDSMRIIAPGVTHRDTSGTGGGAGSSIITSITDSINKILDMFTRVPPVPPPLEITTEEDSLIPFAPPGPQGIQGPQGISIMGPPGLEQEEQSLVPFATPIGTVPPRGVTKLTGTANQVIASASDGAVTLSLPQDIAVTSSPTFGGISISKTAADANFVLSASAGQSRQVVGETGGVLRWLLRLGTNHAETGGDVGSNFDLTAYNDAANTTTTPVSILRGAGGHITVARPVDITGDVAITGSLTVSTPAPFITTFVPVVTSTTGALTSVSATCSYLVVGNICFYSIVVTLTTVGAGINGTISVTLPVPATAVSIGCGREDAILGAMLQSKIGIASTMDSFTYNNGSWAIGNGAVGKFSGFYLV